MCEVLRQYFEDADGSNQESLAAQIGVRQPTISRWVSGRVPRDQVKRVSDITGIPPENFLSDVLAQ